VFADRVAAFRLLHSAGTFVMPNPWDAGSAKFLTRLGFAALATTSAGAAFARGSPDAVGALPRDAVLANIAEIVAATSLPVNADFQAGFAEDLDALAENVRLCIATGIAGLSIEDATGDPSRPLYDLDVAIARLRAARAAIDETGSGVVLTARCEAWLVGAPDPRGTAVERLVAFAAAGADCLFAPGVVDVVAIRELVDAVSPRPLNVLMNESAADWSVAGLADLGVRRVSVGSALARVAWSAFMRAATALVETGSVSAIREAAPFATLNDMFG